MTDSLVPTENRLPEEIFVGQIKQTLQKIRPALVAEGKLMPAGFQMDIQGPYVEVFSPKEYQDLTGRKLDSFGATILGANVGKFYAPQILGLLNITGASSPQLSLEYRSKTGGKNFEVTFEGNDLSIKGDVAPEEIYQALNLLFTQNGEISRDDKAIHARTARNLNCFDRDGNPIQSKKRIPESPSSNSTLIEPPKK